MLEYLLWGSATFTAGVGAGHYGPRFIQNTLETRRNSRKVTLARFLQHQEKASDLGLERCFARDRLLDAIFHRNPKATKADLDLGQKLLGMDLPDIDAMNECAMRLRGESKPAPAEVAVEKSSSTRKRRFGYNPNPETAGTILDLEQINSIKTEQDLADAIEVSLEALGAISEGWATADLLAFRLLMLKANTYAHDVDARDELDTITAVLSHIDDLIKARENLAASAVEPETSVWVSIHHTAPKDRILGDEPHTRTGYQRNGGKYQRVPYGTVDASATFMLPRGTYTDLGFWTEKEGGHMLGMKSLPIRVHVGTDGGVVHVKPNWELLPV